MIRRQVKCPVSRAYRTCGMVIEALGFYKGESQGKKQPRRLEGAKMFAALSSPSHVERLWGVRSSQIRSVFVTALWDSEARQAAWLNVVNHSSI